MADGIELTLNTDSRVRTSVEGNSRVLDLEKGEVLLSVPVRSQQPSVLRLGDLELEVASARVHARWELDGSRRFEMLSGEGKLRSPLIPVLLLESGQSFRVRGNLFAIETFDRETVERRLAWMHGEVLLRGETLAEAIAEFNRYNDRKLIISDGKIAGLKIGGRFDATDIDAFARSLHYAFGIKVIDGRAVTGGARTIVLVGGRARRV